MIEHKLFDYGINYLYKGVNPYDAQAKHRISCTKWRQMQVRRHVGRGFKPFPLMRGSWNEPPPQEVCYSSKDGAV